ncbi:GNAT family N-acetyltransferase [Psychrobacter sp. BI730]|uniref:GNAT family N-acetyltransferase n=1 Tax=Psychrobacter sp. BI730 TaxID=2705463 RepID=UPI0015CBAE63|nr:GNAT family N-acetyltransferase [Psychrobacter sp. BI730]NYR10863.1 GNAT family N-acetyltransferase [Psychrobacter sp. BI730]
MNEILLLTDHEWLDDYSDKKYRFIFLTLNSTQVSTINLFMLAASRLSYHGEFIIRINYESTYHDIEKWAKAFDFSIIDSSTSQNSLRHISQSQRYIFRFDGQPTKPGYEIALANEFTESCIDLFKNVFGTPISQEFWNWKYPKDRAVSSVVALRNSKVVAHYGSCDRSGIYNNRSFGLIQACDVMVAPTDRGAISSSVFFELAKLGEKTFYAKDSAVLVAYGFPHGRHYKLGARLKLYTPVSPIFEVIFDIPDTVEDASALDINCIYSKSDVSSALKFMYSLKDTLILDRDYQYLLKRYIYHPEFEYKVYWFAECLFIIRPLNGKLFLMDYWGDLTKYSHNLNLFTNALSTVYPGYHLHLWCLEDISTSFINHKEIKNTGAVFVLKKYSSELPNFRKWWVMMGDTEFL